MFEPLEELLKRYEGHLQDYYVVHSSGHEEWEGEDDFSCEEMEEEIIEYYVDCEGWWGDRQLSYEEFRAEYCENSNPIFW